MPDTPSIIGDSVESMVQRVDAQRVLQLALQSQGINIPDSQVPSLLRDIEEGGYTLRLTTSEERTFRNRHGGYGVRSATMPDTPSQEVFWTPGLDWRHRWQYRWLNPHSTLYSIVCRVCGRIAGREPHDA